MKLDDEISVVIGLYHDAVTPGIKALILEQRHGGHRLTSSKGCGEWTLERRFKCSFTLRDLKTAMRQADRTGEG